MKQSQTRELERIVTQATNEREMIEQQKPKAYEKKEDKEVEINEIKWTLKAHAKEITELKTSHKDLIATEQEEV